MSTAMTKIYFPRQLFLFKWICYVICNCNIANMDVVALYLLEQLNNNLHYTLEKLFFFVRIYIFLSALFLHNQKISSNAATIEKKANSLIVKFFILMKVQSLVNAYYQHLDCYYYFSIVRALQNFSHFLFIKSLLKVCYD